MASQIQFQNILVKRKIIMKHPILKLHQKNKCLTLKNIITLESK